MTTKTAAALAALAAHPELRPRKLQEPDVCRMREAYASGASISALSREFHADRKTVRDIVQGKAWRHLTRPTGWDDARVRGLRAAGWPVDTLARFFDLDPRAVEEPVDRLAVDIRRALANGLSVDQIAKDFLMSPETVRAVLDGRA